MFSLPYILYGANNEATVQLLKGKVASEFRAYTSTGTSNSHILNISGKNIELKSDTVEDLGNNHFSITALVREKNTIGKRILFDESGEQTSYDVSNIYSKIYCIISAESGIGVSSVENNIFAPNEIISLYSPTLKESTTASFVADLSLKGERYANGELGHPLERIVARHHQYITREQKKAHISLSAAMQQIGATDEYYIQQRIIKNTHARRAWNKVKSFYSSQESIIEAYQLPSAAESLLIRHADIALADENHIKESLLKIVIRQEDFIKKTL